MIAFIVVNPEVLIARELERGGRHATGLDFIRWRLAELRRETIDDGEFWGIDRHDIARSRAAQLAEERVAAGHMRTQLSARNCTPAAAIDETAAKVGGP